MDTASRTTRKVLFAIGVVVTFVAYSLVLRNQGSRQAIAPPPSLSQKPSSQATTVGSSGSRSSGSSLPTSSGYKNGTYTGSVANAYYGNVQVQAVISDGKITDVKFLSYPNDNPNSQYINSQATPYLRQEAIQAQRAQVDIVTGATLTSQAFVQSLSAALSQAQA